MTHVFSTIALTPTAVAVALGATGIFACIVVSSPVYMFVAPGAVVGWGLYSLYRHLYHSDV
jgi:hypothetical protein